MRMHLQNYTFYLLIEETFLLDSFSKMFWEIRIWSLSGINESVMKISICQLTLSASSTLFAIISSFCYTTSSYVFYL